MFRGIDDAQDASANPTAKRSSVQQTTITKKRVMSANDLLSAASAKQIKKPAAAKSITNRIRTPNKSKSVVDATVAVSPWGLPKDAKVDPTLALSPPIKKIESSLKSAKNRAATPSKSQVHFTSDTVFVEATALRKNVTRKQTTPKKCTPRIDAPFSFAKQSNSSMTFPLEAPTVSFPTTNEQTKDAYGAFDPDERCFEEKRLEHYLSNVEKKKAIKPVFNIGARTGYEKENKIAARAEVKSIATDELHVKPAASSRLRTAMGSAINRSPIKSSKSTIVTTKTENKERKQSSTGRVQFASSVVFTTRAAASESRKNTPYKANHTVAKVTRVTAMSPARARKTSSLLQTGAVRLNVVYHTNPRKRTHGTRLIDSGAVRRVVNRHTTPRKLIANRNMW